MDMEKAVEWYTKAAEQGDVDASEQLERIHDQRLAEFERRHQAQHE